MYRVVAGLMCFGLYVGSAFSQEESPKSFQQTHLYTSKVKDCKSVDLQSWHHPLQKVFKDMMVNVEKMLLCNNGSYPIFFVTPFPETEIISIGPYHSELFTKMRAANGGWPYSFVQTVRGNVLNVWYDKNKEFHVDIEYFEGEELD